MTHFFSGSIQFLHCQQTYVFFTFSPEAFARVFQKHSCINASNQERDWSTANNLLFASSCQWFASTFHFLCPLALESSLLFKMFKYIFFSSKLSTNTSGSFFFSIGQSWWSKNFKGQYGFSCQKCICYDNSAWNSLNCLWAKIYPHSKATNMFS